MAAPIKNNLPPASQQWVRDIERRMADLERENQLLQVTANRNATQIGSVQTALTNSTPLTIAIPPSETVQVTSGSGTLETQVSETPYNKFRGLPCSVLLVTTITTSGSSVGATLRGSVYSAVSTPPYGLFIMGFGYTPIVETPLQLGSNTFISVTRQRAVVMPNTGDFIRASQRLHYTVSGTASLSVSGLMMIFPSQASVEENN